MTPCLALSIPKQNTGKGLGLRVYYVMKDMIKDTDEQPKR